MLKKLFSFIAGATLVATLALPALAQSITVKANVPFEFIVSDREMPAGEYTIGSLNNNLVLALRNEDAGTAALSLSSSVTGPTWQRDAESKLVFRRYGNQYFLAQIWDGSTGSGRALPMTRAERELAQTASAQTFEVLAVRARR